VDIVTWSATEAERLSAFGTRWQHSCAAAERAREIGGAVAASDRSTLISAAYLHDIGYLPELVVYGFHPIDGACWLRLQGLDRLADLVAHHSGAIVQARARGLGAIMAEFIDERSCVSDALTYCDLMTGPAGESVAVAHRLSDIERRHGTDSVTARTMKIASASLLAAVARVEERLARSQMVA
jgi:HD superfamily phosphodiesterase